MSTRDDMDQGGDVGAEVAAVLAAHPPTSPIRCACGWSETLRGWEQGSWENHVADRLAPLIAVRVEAAKAEALREAADSFDGLPNRQTTQGTVAFYLRDRAAALDPGPRP